MKNNPFSLSFGIEPLRYISRESQIQEIYDSFNNVNPTNYLYLISGIRGSGKTVTLSNVAEKFSENEKWIVVNVTPDVDIVNSIAAKLYSQNELKKLFTKAKLDLTVFGLGISIEGGNQIFDIGTALEKMLSAINKSGKRVIVTIDEVVNNEYVRVFASTFQLLLREKLPIFLVMTGLYDNIYNLQNEKTLTFLYRAPKIILQPLRISAIARSYEEVFSINTNMAGEMAQLTKGYAYAFQVLGYLYWKNNIDQKGSGELSELMTQYDEYLEEYVYEKIWMELSAKEREILAQIPPDGEIQVSQLREKLDMSSNMMSVYRDRLKKQGILDTSKYGWLSFALPRFGNIIQYWV